MVKGAGKSTTGVRAGKAKEVERTGDASQTPWMKAAPPPAAAPPAYVLPYEDLALLDDDESEVVWAALSRVAQGPERARRRQRRPPRSRRTRRAIRREGRYEGGADTGGRARGSKEGVLGRGPGGGRDPDPWPSVCYVDSA